MHLHACVTLVCRVTSDAMSANSQFVGKFMALLPVETKVTIDIDPDDLCDDQAVTKKPLEDEFHITLCMTIKDPIDPDYMSEVASVNPPFEIKIEKLNAFVNVDRKFDDGSVHSYDVLYMEVPVTEELLILQAAATKPSGAKWHWPEYKPHITIAYLKAGRAQKYIDAYKQGQQVIECKKLQFRKYKDRQKSDTFVLGTHDWIYRCDLDPQVNRV